MFEVKNLDIDARRVGIIAFVILFISVLGALLTVGEVRKSYLLQERVNITHIEDNKIGSIVVDNAKLHPVNHRTPETKVCLYVSEEQPPFVLQLERSDSLVLKGGETQTFDLMLDIGEEKLDSIPPAVNLNVSSVDRCPLRAEPQLMVKTP